MSIPSENFYDFPFLTVMGIPFLKELKPILKNNNKIIIIIIIIINIICFQNKILPRIILYSTILKHKGH
jgi:hypothetical protein